MKKILQNAIVGMGYGFPATVLCMALVGGWNDAVRELMVWAVASALYGILSAAMFSGELDWPLPLTLAVHCGGCLAITMAAAVLCGYVADLASALPIFVPFAVIYGGIYAVCVWMMKRSEKEINRALEDK